MVRLRLPEQLTRALIRVLLVAAAVSLSSCTHVHVYERGILARPDMTTSDIAGVAASHAIAVHEGATRSGSVAESGCGCN